MNYYNIIIIIMKKETWSHSGRFLVCKKLKFFLGIPNVNFLTE